MSNFIVNKTINNSLANHTVNQHRNSLEMHKITATLNLIFSLTLHFAVLPFGALLILLWLTPDAHICREETSWKLTK